MKGEKRVDLDLSDGPHWADEVVGRSGEDSVSSGEVAADVEPGVTNGTCAEEAAYKKYKDC